MKPAPLPYTSRNTWFAAVLLAVLAGYVSYIADLMAGIQAHNRHGYESEAAGLGVALLVLLALYVVPFAVGVLVAALQRGSKPVSTWVLLLGLLPTIGLAVLILTLYLGVASQ